MKTKAKYTVIDKYIKCAIHDAKGKHILADCTQSQLKKLYENGHKDKIKCKE